MYVVLQNIALVEVQKIMLFCGLKNPKEKECNFKIRKMKMDKKR